MSPPIWLMRQAGRYLSEYRAVRAKAPDFLTLCYTPELAAEITLQPIRRFGLDAAILFSDILVIPDAMGMEVSFREGEGPVLGRLEHPTDIGKLIGIAGLGKLDPVLETVRRVTRELAATIPLIGFAGAPWTVATYMVEGSSDREFTRVKSWAYAEPEAFQDLIDRLVEVTTAYLVRQIEAGAEVIQVFDSWSGVLPEEAFERWCVVPMRRIVEGVHARCPGTPIIGFPRGAGMNLARYVETTGVDGVSLDTTASLAFVRRELQPKVTVQGNLDPIALLLGGEAMERQARHILRTLGDGPFIFNLGHGVLPQTPPDHVAQLVALVREA